MPTGGYYFDPANVPGGILPNMDYQICLASIPAGFDLAPKDADNSLNGDIRDSDAMLIGGKACIPVTTGGPGENNPNLDFGLKLAPPTITCAPPVSVCIAAGATSTNVTYAAPTTTGSNVTVTCSPASGSSFALGTTTVTCTASNSGGQASCSFVVSVTDAPTITCPTNIKTFVSNSSTAVVNFPVPTGGGLGTTVTCDRPSNFAFPIGTTTVKCTATNACGTASCSFTVTVEPSKCDTLCYRSASYWLLNLNDLPNGGVVIYGVNNNAPVSTSKKSAIIQALQGNPVGVVLTPREVFNREYVAAQLNILNQGGPGSPVWVNTMWANLSCYGITFPPIALSSGAVLTRDSMVKELYMHITAAVQSRNDADLAKLTLVLQLLNGNNPLNVCN
jgi:HYR domain